MRSKQNLLWIHGPPLVGKSTAAAMFIDGLKRAYTNSFVAYFIFKSTKTKLSSTRNMICTVAFQLASYDNNVRSALERIKDTGFSITVESDVSVLCNTLIRDPLSHVHKDIFLVLDGLDEIGNREEREDLLDFLTDLSSNRASESAVRLLVLTRVSIGAKRLVRDFVPAKMDYRDNERDIQTYVSEVISASQELRLIFERAGKDPSVYFREKSNGTFIWAVKALEALSHVKSVREFDSKLQTLSEGSGSTEALYLENLSGFDPIDRRRIDKILQWVVITQRPLSVDEIKTAVEWSLEDEFTNFPRFLEIDCASVLHCVHTSAGGTSVELIENKLRAVLETPTNLQEWPNHVPKQMAHSFAALLCLTALQSAMSTTKLNAFRPYASEFWTHHVSQSERSGSTATKIFESVFRFFTTEQLAAWIKSYLIKKHSYSLTSRFEFEEPNWSTVMAWLRGLTMKPREKRKVGEEVEEFEAVLNWREEVLESGIFNDYIGKAAVSVWLSEDLEDFIDVAAAFHLAYKHYRVRASQEDPDDLYGDLILTHFRPMLDWAKVSAGNQRNMGIAFASLRRYRDAITCYQKSTDQDNPVLWEYLGHMYHAIGDYESEIRAYEMAFQRDPTRAPPAAYLTYATRDIISSINMSENTRVRMRNTKSLF